MTRKKLYVPLPRGALARHAWYPVPGWIGDPQPRSRKFELWLGRPPAACRLYWRTHPELYDRMLGKLRIGKKSENRHE